MASSKRKRRFARGDGAEGEQVEQGARTRAAAEDDGGNSTRSARRQREEEEPRVISSMAEFRENVYDLLLYGCVGDEEDSGVGGVPEGWVTTYGCVAERLGSRKVARHVGWALNALKGGSIGEDGEDIVPWWRVVNGRGEVSFRPNDKDAQGRSLQAMRLEREGVAFEELGGGVRRIVDFEEKLWRWG